MTNKKRFTISIVCLLMLIVSMFAFSACGGKVENFNLSFKVDGESYSTISTNGSEIVTIPENPTKEGYEFDGWYWDENVWSKPFTANSLLNAPITSDMSVYAKFDAISYDITYETDNGSHSNPVSYTIEDSFALSDAEKLGYNFIGWYSDDTYTTEVTNISVGSMGAITLYAKYEVATYTITYENTKDATNNNATSYTIESATITLENLEKPGYIFDGWYNNGTKVTEIATGSTGNLTLTAQWTPIGYEIKYHNVTGASNNNPDVYDVEDQPLTLSDASKVGYTFTGWYTDSTCQTKIDKIAVGTTGELNLYAGWEIIEYTATFKDGDDTVGKVTFTVETESIEEPTVPVHNGYTGQWADYELGVSDITIDAEYTPIVYAITYENIQGIDNKNVTTYTVESETITLVAVEKPHYIFDGWYNNGTKVTEIATGSTGNLTLTAQWTPVSYTVSYENTKDATNNNVTSYTIESATITLENLEKPGYIFDGWYNNGTKVTEIATGSTGNLTLTAQWTPIGYEIKYHNVTGASNNNPDVYDVEDQPLTLSDASKVGYTFTGWYTDSTCQTKIDKIAVGTTGELNLYAGWEIIEYTATFKDGDDTVGKVTFTVETESIEEPTVPVHNGYTGQWADYELGVSDITIDAEYTIIVYTIDYENTKNTTNNNVTSYTIESATITLENLEKPGYIFDGWYNNGTKVTEIATGSTGNLTLTAQWTPVSYTVSYENTKDATNNNVTSYTIESATITLENLEKPGYIFDGWYNNGTKVTEIATGSTGNLTLTAQWTPIGYEIKYHNVTGATNDNPSAYTIESEIITLLDANKVGYTFLGWYTDAMFENSIAEIPTGTTGILNLYAKWEIITYTITYKNTKEATNPNPTTYTVESEIELSKIFAANYTFNGWYSGMNLFTIIPKGSTGNLVLTATWVDLSLGEIDYDHEKVAISVNDEITAELFDARCYDSNNTLATMSIEVDGTQAAGETITVRLIATSGNKTKQETITNIKVYDTPTLTVSNDSKDYINVTDTLNGDLFGAIGTDSFGATTEILVSVEGDFSAGNLVTVVITAVDPAQNTFVWKKDNIKVYGSPTISIKNTNIKESDGISIDSLGAVATDSFGVTQNVSIYKVDYGFSNGGVYKYQTSTMEDSVVFTALNTERYTLHYKNGYSGDRTYITVYCVTTNTTIRARSYYTNTGYSTFGFSVIAGYEYKICTQAYSSSYTTEFYMYLTSTSLTETVVAEEAQVILKSTDAYGNIGEKLVKIKVFGLPTISEAAITDFKVGDEISVESLKLTAVDTYGQPLEISLAKISGEQIAGSTMVYTASVTDIVGNVSVRDIELKFYGTPTINVGRTHIKVNEIINTATLQAIAKDSFGNTLNVTIEKLEGSQIGGSTMRYLLTTDPDKVGNTHNATVSISVYDENEIELSYAPSTFIKLTSKGEEFFAEAQDSFGNACEISLEAASGYTLAGGEVVTLYIVATDKAGNIKKSEPINNIKVYDIPTETLTNPSNGYSILEDGALSLLFTVHDSFGEEVYAEITTNDELVGGRFISVTINATDVAGNTLTKTYDSIAVFSEEYPIYAELYIDGEFWKGEFVKDYLSVPQISGQDFYAWIDTEWNIYTDSTGKILNDTISGFVKFDGVLYSEGYSPIASAADLTEMSLSGKYILVRDIDLENVNWTPIGTQTSPFTGELNGNGYTVHNFKVTTGIKDSSCCFAGLIGYNSGTIKNIRVEEFYISIRTGSTYVYAGGLVGYNTGTIIDCTINYNYISGSAFFASQNGNASYAGGISGANTGTINNSYATGEQYVKAWGNSDESDATAGGITGLNGNGSVVINCCATGNVIASAYDAKAGGLVGFNNKGQISYSYSTCKVESSLHEQSSGQWNANIDAGGIAGVNYGSTGLIKYCYATGNVTATASSAEHSHRVQAGGLVGNNYEGAVISDCYATGNVIGISELGSAGVYAGGLVGYNHDDILNCYATGNVSATAVGGSAYAGGLLGYLSASNSNGRVNYSYATGDVSAVSNSTSSTATACAGGLIAYENITYVNYSYRCSEQTVTATINSAEGTIHKNNLKSLETIQTVSFHTDTLLWDSSIWNIQSGTYPTLYGVGVK